MFEAAERYSLQYNPAHPKVREPVEVLNGPSEPLGQRELCLGAPDGSASSIGCAAGISLEDAAGRAAFEILEHHQLGRLRSGKAVGLPFDPATVPGIAATVDYLGKRLRQVRAVAVTSPEGYSVVWAVTCDPDGGRPTEGSAASASVDAAATKAVEEAVFSWRNMIELERNGVMPSEGTTDLNFRIYRGAEKVFAFMPVPAPGIEPPRLCNHGTRPVEILATALSTRVRIFDMTEPSLRVPVVRVVAD